MSRALKSVAVLIFASVISTSIAHSQATASLRGTISDPSGAVKLLVNTPETLDLKLSLSTAGEIVNVASEASQVNTTDASVGNPFSETQGRQLPLQTRNVVELLSLQPGVTTSGEVLGSRRDH